MSGRITGLVTTTLTGLMLTGTAFAQLPPAGDPSHPGREVYEQFCATCHGNPEFPRAHAFETLRLMNADALSYSLTEGMMSAQGSALSDTQTTQVVSYLASPDGTDAWLAGMMCSEDNRVVNLNQRVSMGRLGVDENNSRFMSAEMAGLDRGDMANLELAWAVAFPDTGQLRAAPVVIGDTLFYAATGTQKVMAMDVASGCVKWVYDSPNRLRSSLTYGELGDTGRHAIVFGDAFGSVHAVDAATGEGIWLESGRATDNPGNVTGAVVLHDDKVIVPISASGVAAGANPEFECCVGHGAVTALNAATGEKLWEYHTMPTADYTGLVNSVGVRMRGPSGAPIWSTPTVDAERGSVYVTTGENTSHPATETSDAIISLDLETGEPKWVFQALANDVWNMACGARQGPNCPTQAESVLRDHDFGGSAILVKDVDGRDLLLAGQKSGDLWAVNPDTGEVIWNQKVGEGTALGGNHWGVATDGRRVFHPINDPGTSDNVNLMPGMYSFFVASGESSWSYEVQADCSGDRAERVPSCEARFGFSATPLVVDGAVIQAGIDGRLFIFDADNGEVLFEYDTAVEYETANGIKGNGGAIDAHSIAAGSGMLFIGTGYGAFGQPPGNVLLAFKAQE